MRKMLCKQGTLMPDLGTHTFNPSTLRQKQVNLCGFKASLDYMLKVRSVKAI